MQRLFKLKVIHSKLFWKCQLSSGPQVFSVKGLLKICSKSTGEHPCRSAISIKLHSNFIEITFRHGYSPVNLLHIFRAPFLKNTFGQLLWIVNLLSATIIKQLSIQHLANNSFTTDFVRVLQNFLVFLRTHVHDWGNTNSKKLTNAHYLCRFWHMQ